MDDYGVTTDLSEFGLIELDMAMELLDQYAKAQEKGDDLGLTTNVRIAFNKNSGYVFLTDDDYNVVMINPETKKAEKYYICGVCGFEGFKDEFKNHSKDPECLEEIRNQLSSD